MIKLKLFIATPAFSGTVNIQYAISLAETMSLLNSNGIEVKVQLNASGSLLVAERNRLNKAFLATDCTHMLCIDSDIGWPAQAVLALLQKDMDFVAGLYPARGPEKQFLFRAVTNPDNGSMIHNEKGLFQMEYIPAGFMMLKRIVIERMNVKFANLYYEPKSNELKHENGYCLFDTEVRDGEFWGEDYTFCYRARQAGFEIWIDPAIEFDHAGNRAAFSVVLTQKSPDEQESDRLKAESQNKETKEG